VRPWPSPQHHQRRGALATEATGEGAHEVQHGAEKAMPCMADDEEV
jgi:hypothetical protein